MNPTEKEKKLAFVRVQIEYGFGCFQVRFRLVVSTVWIGSEYGFVILLDEGASESHTQNSTRTAPHFKLCWACSAAPQTAIGDSIAAIGPYSAIASTWQVELRYPAFNPCSSSVLVGFALNQGLYYSRYSTIPCDT